jgi:hypothetical protein
MTCRATADAHCCYVPDAGVCPHFDESRTDGFCTLRAELGSWDLVHRDPRYAPQRTAFEAFPTSLCGDFPQVGEDCGACGAVSTDG